MRQEKPDLTEVMKAVADGPKRDNSAYHEAMAQARRSFEEAESAMGGPVRLKIKTKRKGNGDYVVKWVFKPDR